MPLIINEQKFINDNTFLYESKLKSPTSRFFQDMSPSFATYFHINSDTTTDAGYLDVASVVGSRSPLRFDKIDNLPIYGINQLVLQLEETEQGLDSNFSDEAILTAGTIKPVPNDFFIIPILKNKYIFRITSINYDIAVNDMHYKFNYQLEYISDEQLAQLNKQTTEEFECIIDKIGTDEKCIIKKTILTTINKIQELYNHITDYYKAMYYNERYNVFLCETDNGYLYDPMQADFINKHNLFNKKNDLSVLILTDQFDDAKRPYKYNKSIYKFIEMRDLKMIDVFKYILRPGITINESSFARWFDKTVQVVDTIQCMPVETSSIFNTETVINITDNKKTGNICYDMISEYINNSDFNISNIPEDIDDLIVYMRDGIEVYFFTPIILYIIKEAIHKEIEKKN